jgi:hypothetical protein
MTATFAAAFGRAKLVLPGIRRTATIRAMATDGPVVMRSGRSADTADVADVATRRMTR